MFKGEEKLRWARMRGGGIKVDGLQWNSTQRKIAKCNSEKEKRERIGSPSKREKECIVALRLSI